jgi:hypothetical protein
MDRRDFTNWLLYFPFTLFSMSPAITSNESLRRRAASPAIYWRKRERAIHGSEQRGAHARERPRRGSVVRCD